MRLRESHRLKVKPLPFIPFHPRLVGAFFTPKRSEWDWMNLFRESRWDVMEDIRGEAMFLRIASNFGTSSSHEPDFEVDQ